MEKDFYKTYFRIEQENWWFKVRRNLIFDLFAKYKVSYESKIFDFGCGSGYLVGELQKMGYNAFGVDFEKEAIRYGLNSGIKNLTVGTGEKIDHLDRSFDLVTILDVLEHIENERSLMVELVRILKPGGKIIITVPAYQWMWGIQDEVAHHYRRYIMKSILKLVKDYPSLSVVKNTYFNTFLFLPVAIVRLVSKWFSLKGRESDFDINNKWLNKLFFFIFDLERKVLKYINFPFGVSILLIAKKEKNI